LCGDPADRHRLEIAVLHEPTGRGGSQWIHTEMRAGDRVTIHGPRNHFRFDETANRVIFVAGGIGITPIMAMAATARRLGIDYHLHYCGRGRASMAFVDELAATHGDRLHVHARQEGPRADFSALFATPDTNTQIYACGPQELLDGLAACTRAWPEDALRVEHFHSRATAADEGQRQPFTVELRDSGLTIPVRADQSLLDALRQANIDVQSDCQEGLCGSCEVRVIEGDVDHRDSVLTRGERLANDRMMSCCSRARGEKLVVNL
jgi:ferredoxin-NADP reductase